MSKIKVLVGCKNVECATEVSYHLDMVAMLDGEPICENCYDEEYEGDPDSDDYVHWHDLPPVTMSDLEA